VDSRSDGAEIDEFVRDILPLRLQTFYQVLSSWFLAQLYGTSFNFVLWRDERGTVAMTRLQILMRVWKKLLSLNGQFCFRTWREIHGPILALVMPASFFDVALNELDHFGMEYEAGFIMPLKRELVPSVDGLYDTGQALLKSGRIPAIEEKFQAGTVRRLFLPHQNDFLYVEALANDEVELLPRWREVQQSRYLPN